MTLLNKLTVLSLLIGATLPLASCVTKQTTRRAGVVVDEKYVVKRPVKKFIETVEVEP